MVKETKSSRRLILDACFLSSGSLLLLLLLLEFENVAADLSLVNSDEFIHVAE